MSIELWFRRWTFGLLVQWGESKSASWAFCVSLPDRFIRWGDEHEIRWGAK